SGTRPAPGPDWRAPLTGEAAELVGALFDGPGAVSAAGRRGQPHMLVRYLEGLAASYHGWARSSDAVRGPAADAVALCSAASGVLGAGLALLGASAPTRPSVSAPPGVPPPTRRPTNEPAESRRP